MKHRASPRFWSCYRRLPEEIQRLADRDYELLCNDPRHPSLHFKKVGELWSTRVGLHYRALAVEDEKTCCGSGLVRTPNTTDCYGSARRPDGFYAMKNALDFRKADHPIEPLFLKRWSPRAMSGEPLSDGEMLTLFEAARWAPSTYNEQEWRFLYARRETPTWKPFFDLLMEANQAWCKQAALLVVVLSHKVFARNGKPNPVHLFDTGTAFENLALQGAAMGLVVHGMAGFDFDKARTVLKVPDDYAVAAMIAIGKPGDEAQLPEPLRQREMPSDRKPVKEIICEGAFAFGE